MILVVWMTRTDSGKYTDHWYAYELMKEAEAQYKQLTNQEDVYSASICGVIKSTDYQPYKETT